MRFSWLLYTAGGILPRGCDALAVLSFNMDQRLCPTLHVLPAVPRSFWLVWCLLRLIPCTTIASYCPVFHPESPIIPLYLCPCICPLYRGRHPLLISLVTSTFL